MGPQCIEITCKPVQSWKKEPQRMMGKLAITRWSCNHLFAPRILHNVYMYVCMYIYICVCVSHETTRFTSFYQPRLGQPVAKGLRIWLCLNARWETHGMAKCVEFNRGKYRQTMIKYDRLILGLFGCQIWDHTFFGPSTSSSYKTQLAAFSPLERLNVL